MLWGAVSGQGTAIEGLKHAASAHSSFARTHYMFSSNHKENRGWKEWEVFGKPH